jgi:hypothetical protein
VLHRELIDLLGLQLNPADPLIPTRGDDLQAAGLRALQQLAAILAQDHPLARVIPLLKTELEQQRLDLRLIGLAVERQI